MRHIPKVPSPGSLRVNVMVGAGERFHVDTVDLYSAKQRAGYVEAAATELRAERDAIKAEARPGAARGRGRPGGRCHRASRPTRCLPMSTAEREDALALLSCARPHGPGGLGAFATLGVVGEQTSALTAWLTLTSRLSTARSGR